MRRIGRLLGFLLVTGMATASPAGSLASDPAAVAREAVTMAVALPPGYHRDLVLRAVSRNLRWFGQPAAGLDAARAMSDHGVDEVAPGARPRLPRMIPLKQATSLQNPCDAGIWREQDGSEAASPQAREMWAQKCLLERDFHYIGLPDAEQVRVVAETLPPGDTKGRVLAMMIRSYRDAGSLRVVERELAAHRAAFPAEAREGLDRLMANPAVLYILGRRQDAIAAARASTKRGPKQEVILMLIRDDAVSDALAAFESLERASPAEFMEGCYGWFGLTGGLEFWSLGNARTPAPALGRFLDGLASSPFFRRVCSDGLPAGEAVANLLIAGRHDAAIARARREPATPFLLVDALLQSATVMMRVGQEAKALEYAKQAGAALPPFDPGDRSPHLSQDEADAASMTTGMAPDQSRDFGEASGHTARRFEVIRLLAAAGGTDDAERLARRQPVGAMRAVALSAAVAGMAGLRFDEQAPPLSTIEAGDVWETSQK